MLDELNNVVRVIIPQQSITGRADRVLAEHPEVGLSRSALTRLIRSGRVLHDGVPLRASTVLQPGDQVEILSAPVPEAVIPSRDVPSFSILSEDADLVVLDKPAGLVVHPGAGRAAGTLVDALVADRPEMIGVGEEGRWGVVHRLDRDTSGVMVVAKTDLAYTSLTAQFREHSVHRIYLALVRGAPGPDEAVIDVPIGRHGKDRKRISTSTRKPRHAVTRWKVVQRLQGLTLLEVRPETGRTHQIRVHLASVGLPVAGDPVYGRARKRRGSEDKELKELLHVLQRQALHAAVLGFVHPRSAAYVELSSPLPADMKAALVEFQGMGYECTPTK